MVVEWGGFSTSRNMAGHRHLSYHGPRPETLEEAWDITIEKWEAIVQWYKEEGDYLCNGGTATCGLCLLHVGRIGSSCHRTISSTRERMCPIYGETRKMHCNGNHWYQRYCDTDNPKSAARWAKKELEFLVNLRRKSNV